MIGGTDRKWMLARPTAAGITAIVVLGALTAVSVLADPPTQTQVRAATAEVEISYFRRSGDQGMVMGSATGAPPPAMRTITVDAGETVLFQWGFRTRNAVGVTATINYGSESISLMPGSPHSSTDGWTRYENQRNVTVREAGVYTFRVVALRGASAEKSIQVNVRSAGLQTLIPNVDPSTRRVTFRVRNSGDADAVGRFTVGYQIQGRDPMRPLVESSLQTAQLTLAPHQQMDLGHVDLPEEAWQSAQLWMRVRTDLMGVVSLPGDSHDFTYSWPTRELRISATDVRTIGEVLLTGDVLIDNYTRPTADVVNTFPYATNASHINLMGTNLPFTFKRIRYNLMGVEQFFFVNNFRAPLGGPTFLTIENGKLVMRASFDCGRSDREVKGWTRDYIGKRYVDNTTPDVDIQRFNIAISMTPTLRGGKFSYRDVGLGVDSAMRFPDGWAWLNGFKGWMNDEVQDSVRANFVKMFDEETVKATIENELTNVVMTLGGPMGIHDLVSVRGSGNQIIVAYR